MMIAALLALMLVGGGDVALHAQSRSPEDEAVAARLKAELGLNVLQMNAAYAVAAALRATPEDRQAVRALQAANAKPMPERLRVLAELGSAGIERLRRLALAMDVLYAVLTPEQRARLDASAPPAAPQTELDAELPDLPEAQAKAPEVPPDWFVRPTLDQLWRVYPTAAMIACKGGQARVRCAVDEQGYLKDCKILAEQPQGLGFGNASLQATAFMRMTPRRVFGRPTVGEAVIPMQFSPDEHCEPPPVPTSRTPAISSPAP